MRLEDEIIEKLMEHGKQYIPGLLPRDFERGKVGNCFDVCVLAAIKNPGLKYVEGIAKDPKNDSADVPESVKWILHAWLTDGVYAYDLTWRAYAGDRELPVPTNYIGLEMDIMSVVKFMRATGYQGVIANAWRNRELSNPLLKALEVDQV